MDPLNIKINNWFIADIIGKGIYQLIDYGINTNSDYYAIVKCKKLFLKGFDCYNHETTCHPINPKNWNKFKIINTNE